MRGFAALKVNGYIVAGGVLLAVAAGLAALDRREESAGTVLGAAVGAMLIGLVVAWLGRFLWVLVFRRGSQVLIPEVLFAAGLISVIAAFMVEGEEAREREEFASEGEECRETQPEPLMKPPSGFTYRPLSTGQETGARELFSGTGLPTDLLSGRNVTRGGTRVGGVFVVAAGSFKGDDFITGARQGAEDQGASVSEITVRGQDAFLATLPAFTQIATLSGCYAVTAVGADRPTATTIAEAVVREGQ